jgi:hypothetical protein
MEKDEIYKFTLAQWQLFFIDPFERRNNSQSPPRQSSG